MRRIKGWVEDTFDMTFGDTLNVSLFVLSILAIVISFISLHVAIATKKSADTSGEQQLKTLEDTRKSIGSLLVTLQDSNQILSDSSRTAIEQQKQLEIQAEISGRQLNILDEQWKSESTKPDIRAQLRNSAEPSISFSNLSSVKPITQGKYELIMVDVNKPYGVSFQLVETAAADTGWIAPGGSYLPSKLSLIRIPDGQIQTGDKLFGYLSLDCIDCPVHHVYGVYIEFQKRGFYRELSPKDYSLVNFRPDGMEQRIRSFLALPDLASMD